MSIRYIVGNPGSGKSYMGAKVLYDAFIRPKKISFLEFLKSYNKGDIQSIKKDFNSNFNIAYTNINEFKFDVNLKIKKFEFDKFMIDLSVLYGEYKKGNVDDSRLNKMAQELGLYKALFVIDEVHNFFNKDNEILQWWLTYHRHLYQELYLITQDLSLVATEYKTIAEFFFKAVDSSKRFFSKKFRYIQYSSYKLYQKDIIKKFHVDFEKEVFDLYHSGNNGLGKSAVKKFMWIAIFFALIVFILFKILVSTFLTSDEAPAKKDDNVTNVSKNLTEIKEKFQNKKSKISTESNDYFYYSFSCIQNYCSFVDSADSYRYEVIVFLMSKTEKMFEIKRGNGLKGLIFYDVVLKDDVFKPLNITYSLKENTDEKKSKDIDSFTLGSLPK